MLTDKQLLARLESLSRMGRRLDTSVILLLIRVEDRRLDRRMACPSLYDFCRRRLGMSDGTAHRRVEASRLVRRIPVLIDFLKSGAVTLSALVQVRNVINETNYEAMIAKIHRKTRDEIDELVASLAPQPDAPALLRRLPGRATGAPVGTEDATAATRTTNVDPSTAQTPTVDASARDGAAATDGAPAENGPAYDARLHRESADHAPGLSCSATTETGATVAGADTAAAAATASATLATPLGPRPRLKPLSEERWRLQLTADRPLYDKLQRARTLMRHRNPSGDLTLLIHAALDSLLEDLEKTRSGKPNAPARAPRTVKAGAISVATRRAVFERDGERCTYVDRQGERCPATTFLELDHITPKARDGSGEPPNLRVRCRAHNMLHAEESFGRAHIAARIRERRGHRRGPSQPSPGPAAERGGAAAERGGAAAERTPTSGSRAGP